MASIANMISKLGDKAIITSDPDQIRRANKLILPGVGHFDFGMNNLKSCSILDVLQERVIIQRVPILGICLGVQLFTKGSDEGREPGLGWINAYTRAFDTSRLDKKLKLPHMGWADVEFKKSSKMLYGFSEVPRFYFVHGYHLVCENKSDELVTCNYGYDFVAGIEHENILGVQFHPEKSHRFGMRMIENFIKNY